MMNEIKENSLDICVVTETWLNNLDDIWLERSECNYDGFSVSNVNRKIGKYWRLVLITRRPFTVKQKVIVNKDTFEYAIRELKIKTYILNILVVYRPPYSQGHQLTIPQFIDEFLETFTHEISSLEIFIVSGDFNIEVDVADDPDVQAFVESMYVLRLDQHVNCETHVKGHILDHI